MVPKIQVVKVETMKKISFKYGNQRFFRSLKFDDLYFRNHWDFRDVMYLILKISSVVMWILKLKDVTALLLSSMPF